MNIDDYNQIVVNKTCIDSPELMKEGEIVSISINTEDGLPLSVDMPASVILKVTHTEPGLKGNTATNATKPATVETGAKILTGGKRKGNKGYFFEPTVMTNVSKDSRIMNEEPFGPLAPINSFSSIDEVVEESNRLNYGLAAYAYTNSAKTAQDLGQKIESGQVSINHHGLGLVDTPFGGVKDSGYGSEGGPEGLDAYMTTKLVSQTGL